MIGAIIQARMGSSRLPGKVMMNVDDKSPMLFFVIRQLQSCKLLKELVIATTDLKEDNIIVDYAAKIHIKCFRGNAQDVLDRYYKCAKEFSFSTIVRITSDCPLIDPQIVDNMINEFNTNSYDYITNTLVRTFPYGTDVEIFSFNALESAWSNAKLPSEREHVTPFIRNHDKIFKIHNIESDKNLSNLSWTVDRMEDLNLVRTILAKINKRPILMQDILELFSKDSKLFEINKNHMPNEGYLKSLMEDEKILKLNLRDVEGKNE